MPAPSLNKVLFCLLLLTGLLLITGVSSASDLRYQATPEQRFIEATGRAEVVYGDEHSARVRAMRDAVQNASMQVSAQVRSSQTVESGSVVVDHLRVHSAARVTQVEVLSEGRSGNFFEVNIQARVAEDHMCANHVVNDFAKSVAVTGFALEDATQTTVGHLGDVDRQLASYLVNAMNGETGLRALNANHMMLYPSVSAAPTRQTTRNTLSWAVDAARDMGVQFVVSGVVRDLGMEEVRREISDEDGLVARLSQPRNTLQRQMMLDVYVHDGYSGALVFQSRYSTSGEWNYRSNEKVGFATSRFFASEYGQNVRDLLRHVVDDVQEAVQCQPFMANIAQVDGDRIYIQMGAESGLRPGDDLSVYRTSTFFDRRNDAYNELTDTQLVARVTQVQPNFAIAELPVTAERLNLQPDDLVIAW
ncbi:MAG: flagellar assembly protein FlgT [Natronospirillum sp.]|uniref:flagellar assembly protein T N-terminal domain-containing protein n=1 Tax=Natronospirillum sp. TaxID=2812955 RepID=UPI0025F77FF8|nr:flagellar assembly protein T N-terminal domain-containing protein [Natronospirillum sp.]MCH8552586.1 flagellar assembly protein FlgT [Natronospirillum sp.]